MTLDWASHSEDFLWKQWRQKGLGSSDAPVILGVSPWRNAHDLLLEKTGEKKSEFKGNFATQRGKDLEPIVRAKYNEMFGCDCQPANLVSVEYDHWRASLDGIDRIKGRIIEIKCPGKVDHATALEGKIPKKYQPQCQWQLIVSGAAHLDYVSWDGKSDDLVIVRCNPDHEMMKELMERSMLFWELVTKRIDFLKDKK